MSQTFQIIRDEVGRLILRRPGEDDLVGVRIRRAFPWSNPAQHISIRNPEGKEILLLPDLSGVEPAIRQLIEQVLDETCFIPRITCIDKIDLSFDHQQWTVQTDRGPAEFRVKEREDVRFLADGRFTVKDADGNVYELPQIEKLDEASRRCLERLV